jgi:hypothetical protein
MITPLHPQAPATGLLAVDPAAARQAAAEAHAPIVEPGQSPRDRSDPAGDPRRVPPPPRVDADNRPQPPRPGSPAAPETADFGRDFGSTGYRRRHGAAGYEDLRADRPRPRPSSTFLAQAIGQELAAEDGIGPGVPSAGARSVAVAAALYRQTQDTVDRARFAGLVTPPSDSA